MSDRPSPLALALFVVGLLMSGLVLFALVWSGPEPYRDLARANHVDRFVFVLQPPLDPLAHKADCHNAGGRVLDMRHIPGHVINRAQPEQDIPVVSRWPAAA